MFVVGMSRTMTLSRLAVLMVCGQISALLLDLIGVAGKTKLRSGNQSWKRFPQRFPEKSLSLDYIAYKRHTKLSSICTLIHLQIEILN